MQHYKDSQNAIHYLDDQKFEHLLPAGVVKITAEEVRSISQAAAVMSDADLAAQARSQRDRLLSGCDWTQLADCPLTATQVAAWKAYRQALRDLTQQATFPAAIAWPAVPQ